MRIKKHHNGNFYLLTPEGKWVRNFTTRNVPYVDINKTIKNEDHFIFLKNEIQNGLNRYPWINSEDVYYPNIVIVSDGFMFKEKHKILNDLPKDVIIIGVNGALAKWENKNRNLNYYVVNNPYEECLRFLPRRSGNLPKCICSPRANYNFLDNYRGIKMKYYPVSELGYTTIGAKEVDWQIDDYRNPICAAISLAYQFGVQKLMLFCCDNSFKDKRPGADELENGLWAYPQQDIVHGLIEGNMYWLKSQYQEVLISDHSSGRNYTNASYIEAENILSFFKENNE